MRETPLASFERALAAFDGAPEDFDFLGARKMLAIVASPAGADTVISRDGLTVSWPHCREPYRYVPTLGAAVISALRANAPGGALESTFDLDTRTLATLCLVPPVVPLRFWVTRSADRITVICRAATAVPPALSSPEPLPPCSRPPPVFAAYDPERACPHCGTSARRYRLFPDNFLACLRCGRSQQVEARDLEGATMESVEEPRS